MEDMIPCPIKDQEVFRRVWQRVMAGRDDAQCPIEALPPNLQGDLSCECLAALARAQGQGFPEECERQGEAEPPVTDSLEQEQTAPGLPMEELAPKPFEPERPVPEPPTGQALEQSEQEQPVQECSTEDQPVLESPGPELPDPGTPPKDQPAPEPVPPAVVAAEAAEVSQTPLPQVDGPSRGNDLPRLWEEPQEATDRTARLRRQVMEALQGWQFYRYLARRARAGDARVLNGMAGELHRMARKLSAAYFLLTGLRYWPSELLSAPVIPS